MRVGVGRGVNGHVHVERDPGLEQGVLVVERGNDPAGGNVES